MSIQEKQNADQINKKSLESINNTDEINFNKENLGIHQVKDDNNNSYEISAAKNKKILTQENIGEK